MRKQPKTAGLCRSLEQNLFTFSRLRRNTSVSVASLERVLVKFNGAKEGIRALRCAMFENHQVPWPTPVYTLSSRKCSPGRTRNSKSTREKRVARRRGGRGEARKPITAEKSWTAFSTTGTSAYNFYFFSPRESFRYCILRCLYPLSFTSSCFF